MSTVDVRIDQAALQKLLTGRDGDVAKQLLRGALQVETQAKRYCPVDTGRLRSSITHELGEDGQGLYALIGTNVDYALYVELGDWPFLRPALRAAAL